MPQFNLDEHLFYMLARDFFSRTRQGSFTRSEVVRRLEKIQDEVKRRLAERPPAPSIEEQYEAAHPHMPVEGR